MTAFREEHDCSVRCAVPADALYGIHTAPRARELPPGGRPWHAYGAVKLAAAHVNRQLGHLPDDVADPIAVRARNWLPAAR
jgi:fumarate hydratase class II